MEMQYSQRKVYSCPKI